MELLPDIVGDRPRIVFCGMAGAEVHRTREHYYETPGNSFWSCLADCGLTPSLLAPGDDHLLPDHALGLTDLVHHRDPERFEVDELVDKLRDWAPEWLAFTSKTVAHAAARTVGIRRPGLGPVDWHLADAQVFVLPGTSGANRRRDYDGRPTRVAWWRELAAMTGVGPDA